MPGLVVQLSGEARSFVLLGLDDTANGVTTDPLGKMHGDRSPRREGLREPDVLVGEARCRAPELVVGDDDADASTLGNERDVESRANAHPTSDLLIQLGVVEHEVDTFAPPALEHPSGLGATELELDPREAVRVVSVSVCRGDLETVAVGGGKRNQDEAGTDEVAESMRDESEEGLELDLSRESVPDLAERLEVAKPPRRGLVEPRVLDRDGGLRREQLRQLLVLVREAPPPSFSVRYRFPNATPRSMIGTPRNVRIGGWCAGKPTDRGSSPRSSSRSGLASRISTPRIPRPRGRSPIAACVSASMSVRQEALEARACLVDDAQGRVASARELRGGLDELLQERVQRELRAESDAGIDECAQTVRRSLLGHVLPRWK